MPVRGDLIISEFQAINEQTLTDEDGDSSDWLEIHNSGQESVNLKGYFLTASHSFNVRVQQNGQFFSVAMLTEQVVVRSEDGRLDGATARFLRLRVSNDD